MSDTRLDKLQRLAEQKTEEPFPHYGLAMEHKRLGDLETAIQTFQQLVQKFPDYTAAYFHYGSSLIAAGQEEAACSVLKKGIETAARNGDAHARDELQALLSDLQE